MYSIETLKLKGFKMSQRQAREFFHVIEDHIAEGNNTVAKQKLRQAMTIYDSLQTWSSVGGIPLVNLEKLQSRLIIKKNPPGLSLA